MKTTTNSNSKLTSKRILIETIIIMLITISSVFVSNIFLKYILEAPAFLYLMIEMLIRRRSFRDLGFKISQTPRDLQKNLKLLFLVTMVLQLTPLLIGKAFMPAYIDHLRERMPSALQTFSLKSVMVLFITLIITSLVCLYEEMLYRGFFVERLSWFMKPYAAIAFSTLLFASMHFTPGNPSAVLFDLASVLLDGIIYGVIYIKTRNIYVSFIAHMIANIFGIIMFRLLF
ncbi:CPBP family intramembrane metalloprotease [Anaerocolumna sedimenticola]|uniref:CPBP family intramembrane metalloprotease n=1 Tax=Anaerocolumna sedimenticola TaxID=2696063 RepID=A0A6P1TR16_9FIRM|nr:type II CAAX endopeptidase family protein [Anaerocolumna sedimenticola]QHQ63384.1 CPBP family intramembrane metalloprotease [Anaerocolumna sedimenticola]